MDVQLTWTDCDEAGDIVPNVLSPKELVSGPDNMDETVLHTFQCKTAMSYDPRSILNNCQLIFLHLYLPRFITTSIPSLFVWLLCSEWTNSASVP